MEHAAGVSEAELRPGTKAELPEIVSLLLEMVRELHGPDHVQAVAQVITTDVAQALRGGEDDCMLVARREGRLVGCGRARILLFHPLLRFRSSARHGYLELMYVRPELRAHGLGAAIVGALEGWLRDRGIGTVTLHHSPKARAFHERAGYSLVGEMIKDLL